MTQSTFDLDTLLHPLDVERFLAEHWERAPLYIPRDDDRYFAGLFSRRALTDIVWSTQPSWGAIQLANHTKGPAWRDFTIEPPTVDALARAYDQGDTLILNNVQHRSAPVSRLAAELEARLHFSVHVNMYLTPPGTQGLPPHFDTQDVLILQLEGQKRWRIYGCEIELPFDEQAAPVILEQGPDRELSLRPGDLLYLPRGFVHEAVAQDTASLHLTVSITPTTWRDLLVRALDQVGLDIGEADLLVRALDQVGLADVELRRMLPPGYLDAGASDALADHARTLLQRASERLSFEAAKERLAGELFARTHSAAPGELVLGMAAPALNLDSEVERAHGLCYVQAGEITASIRGPSGAVEGPPQLAPALGYIAAHRSFAIRELPGLSDASKLVLVRRLLKEGLLRPRAREERQLASLRRNSVEPVVLHDLD